MKAEQLFNFVDIMTSIISAAQTLRSAINAPEIVSAPGAYDTISARLIQEAGFPAIYMSGFGATVSRLGLPDLGFMTQSEMAGHARDMVRVTDIPIIADADTGYGGVNNLHRTVREYVQSGVAAIHLEDQLLPKRCGQLGGVRLADVEQNMRHLQVALNAREGDDLLIVARTDALGVEGCEAAIERAKRYADTGVDLVFVDGVKSIADAEAIGRQIDFPTVLSIVDGNETAKLTIKDAQQMGFDVVIHALSCLLSATNGVRQTLQTLRASGGTSARAGDMDTYGEISKTLDLARYEEIDQTFG